MKKCVSFIAGLMSLCLLCNIQAMPVRVNAETEVCDDLTMDPRSSSVFSECYGQIKPGYIYCFSRLSANGTLTMRVVLQKQDSNGNWYDYNTGDPGKTYTGVRSITHTYYCSMPSGGTYRCRYVVTGTVNGVSRPEAGFSGVYYA